ncbi:hypothetical protein GQ53DRAFT_885061 [Thozetella sp. PMI_491]|nr:hypothetical protein GQ53DRAFT_885061 [Thozetella sp. PMI_491]
MASGPTTRTIYSDGIYHGLPTLPDSQQDLTAIVTGANGISGAHMVRTRHFRAIGRDARHPERWTKIYALSRRPPATELPSQVVHVPMDFLDAPEKIAENLMKQGVSADYVFFFAYIQPPPKDGGTIWSAAEELVRVNRSLLNNFLEGLAGAFIIPKRILLQLGTKYYGMHLGPTFLPQEETLPRILTQPNFYYAQEDCLRAFCEKHGCEWNTTLPSWIAGAVPDAAMNLAYPLLLYATIQRRLGKSLIYPGDLTCWENATVVSSALMNAYLSEWAVLTGDAKNERFNATDDSPFTWCRFWPKYAAHFDLPWEGPQQATEVDFQQIPLAAPPLPRGFGPAVNLRFRFTLTEWAKKSEVVNAWREIAEEAGLQNKELGNVDRIFGFADAALLTPWPTIYSNTKLRKSGFFGFVDSDESLLEAFDEFIGLGMAPSR